MDRPRTYTIEELEEGSGFDRRTIAYYVQLGILPKVGRRGRNTRYPQSYLDRLLLVKRIRDLGETGKVAHVVLEDIARLLRELPDESLAKLVAPGEEAERLLLAILERGPHITGRRERDAGETVLFESLQSFSPHDPDDEPAGSAGKPGMHDAGHLQDPYRAALFLGGGGPGPTRRPAPPGAIPRSLRSPSFAALLKRLAALSKREKVEDPDVRTRWIQVEVTEDLAISARGSSRETEEWLERVAGELRRILDEEITKES